ncbi:AraC family transcriptional regulator [Salmonella enterica subsp. enterica]|nr:AraC family transcriptional regulator [Salmonella enterica subsp. enterica]
MYHDVSHLLSRLINGPLPLRQIYFASASGQRRNWRTRWIFRGWRLCWRASLLT